LTGEPGSGKTYLVNEYVNYLREKNINVAITASTGIAATHINGMTIHSWSGIQIKRELTKHDLNKIASSKYIVNRVHKTRVLIIDEISMLLPETVAMVDQVCRKIKQNDLPFGGIQIVFVGDFFQLPPVRNMQVFNIDKQTGLWNETCDQNDQNTNRFAFDSPAWIKSQPVICYLSEQHRQEDGEFLALLSAIRHNAFCDQHLCLLETRQFLITKVPLQSTKLFSHNADVDRLNDEVLSKISRKVHEFTMTSSGPPPLIDAIKKGCLSPDKLYLKVGACVMFTKNNLKKGYANGTLGEVVEFDNTTGYPIVQVRNGNQVMVEPMDWMMEEGDRILAQVAQIPLRLAWAITVHKSQGMNLDEAVMDLSDVFEFGQGYVALSRVRRLSGLFLLGWNDKTFQVHPEILEKDKEFRNASQATTRFFDQLTKKAMRDRQHNFIISSGGKPCDLNQKTKKKEFSFDAMEAIFGSMATSRLTDDDQT